MTKLEQALPNIRRICAKEKDVVTVLKKYDTVIEQRRTTIQESLAVKAKAAAAAASVAPQRPSTSAPDPHVVPKQTIGSMALLWSKDLGPLIAEEVPWIQMKGTFIQLKVNQDILDLLKKEDRAGAVAKFMIDDANQLVDDFVTEFGEKVLNLDLKRANLQQIQKAAQDVFNGLRPKFETELNEIPERRWKKFQSAKVKWKEYKIKVATSVAVGTLQIAAGAGSIAAAVPTMGATLPLAIVATARGVYKTVTEVVELVKEAEQHQKELVSSITNLIKAYQQSKARAFGQEITATLLKGLLGSDALFVESLPKCEKSYEAWQANVAMLRLRNVKFGNRATDLMDKIQKLEAELTTSKPKDLAKLLQKIKAMEPLVTKLLNESADLGGRVSKAEQSEKHLETAMEELRKAVPNYLQVFDKVFPLAVSLGLAAGTGGLELSHAETALEMGKHALQLATEVLDASREAVQG